MIDLKQPENGEYFCYLYSLIRNVARGARNIKSRIVMAKAALNQKKTFHQQIGSKYSITFAA
jgi:hypothetical protein